MALGKSHIDRALALALALDPDNADAHSAYALHLIKKAILLSPVCSPSYYGYQGNALRLAGRIEEAIIALRAYGAGVPGSRLTGLIILFQQHDRFEEAKQEAANLLNINPKFTISSWRNTQFCKCHIQCQAEPTALQDAGLPE
jgi:tetratricopeptide (TPR) repeat protein